MATKKEVLEAALKGEGCLGKAADDEPVFVFRAQDMLAVGVIMGWQRELLALRPNSPKLAHAADDVTAFQKWQLTHGTKIPD